jgi:hypothetical protein
VILLLLRISAIILFCFIQPCFFFSISYAGPVREVIVEWEPIRDAVSYDVEFLNEKDNTVVLKLDEIRQANCKASLAPGSYQVRVRSRDDRGLSGRWGDPQIVMVPDFPIVLKSPADGESIQAENNIGIVTLEWEFSRASGSFPVEIQVFALRLGMSSGVGERPIFSTTTSGQSATIELPVGSSYEARFSSKGSTKSELAKVRFQIVGLPLEAPQIKQIVDENRQLLTFSRPEGAEAISVQIQGLDQKDGQFKLLAELKLKDQLKLSLNELPSNRPLLIQARADSAIRASSASQTFFLDKSVTSQRALNEVKPNVFRRSASTNLFARYNLSSADYFSRSFEKSSISTSSGITGTLA